MKKKPRRANLTAAFNSFIRKNLAVMLVMAFWSIYFVLLWSRQLVNDADGWHAGWVGTWADGAVHLTYMSAFAYRDVFPLTLPIFANYPFTYSFGADMIGGFITKLTGADLFLVYLAWGLGLTLVFIYAFVIVFSIITKSKKVGVLALSLWLTSGGLGGWRFFEDVANLGWWTALTSFPRQYTHQGEHFIEWINVVSSMILPQRSFLLGGIMGLTGLWILWRIFKTQSLSIGLMAFYGLLLGSLTIVHPHTLIVLAIFTSWVMVMTLRRLGRFNWLWLICLVCAALVGLPLIFTFIVPAAGGGFFSWYPGWLSKSKEVNWFWFWWINWGLFLPLALVSYWKLTRQLRLFLLPTWLIFGLANLFLFQPYDWDNSKLLAWVYLLLSLPVSIFLANWFKSGRLYRLAAVILTVVISFSGGLDLYQLLNFSRQRIMMYSHDDVDSARKIRQQTAPDALFLTSDRHNHFIPNLTGRQILMGYPGWLWTYGIDYGERQKDVVSLFSGGERALELLQLYGVDYVVFEDGMENSMKEAREDFYRDNFPLAFSGQHHRIYRIEK